MGWRIAEEVQEFAPRSLSWRDMYFACVLANVTNEHTRICRPGLLTDEVLRQRLRMTDNREIFRVVDRLIEAKVIERITRGQKYQQAEFRFLPLGPADSSQGGESTHPEESQGGESTHADADSGWGVSPLRVGNPPPQGGENTHPSQGLNEDQSLPPSQQIVRDAELGLTEEEEEAFIAWENHPDQNGPHVLKWWQTVARNGDLPARVLKWRAAQDAEESLARASPLKRPCAACGAPFTPAPGDSHPCCPACRPERPS